MSAPTPIPFAEDSQRQAALLAHLAEAGYLACDPPILQPAAAFVESGEDMRGRLFLTQAIGGEELCLRPEFTIPVCRHYLASSDSARPAAFSYCGPVFRLRRDGPGEFLQAGIENLGRTDREAADAEVLALSLDAARLVAPADYATTIGDAGLFSDLLDKLAIPAQWRRRITRGLAQAKVIDGRTLDAVLDAPRGGTDHSGVLAALEGVDRKGARALVEDLLAIAGIATVGGRTAAEIAERFLEQAALRDGTGLSAHARATIGRFLAIEGEPDAAVAELRHLAADVDLAASLDRFESRLNFIVAHDVDLGALRISARFLRNLDYYTGFIFEVRDLAKPDGPPLVGGGRYDRLAGVLGSDTEVPAVGAALWVDRIGVDSIGVDRIGADRIPGTARRAS